MAKKHRVSNFLRLILTVPAIVNLAYQFFGIVHHESVIIRKSILKLIILGMIGIVFLASVWGTLLALLVLYFLSLNLTLVLSLSIVLIFNLLLFIIIFLMIIVLKNRLNFPETRGAIRDLLSI